MTSEVSFSETRNPCNPISKRIENQAETQSKPASTYIENQAGRNPKVSQNFEIHQNHGQTETPSQSKSKYIKNHDNDSLTIIESYGPESWKCITKLIQMKDNEQTSSCLAISVFPRMIQ